MTEGSLSKSSPAINGTTAVSNNTFLSQYLMAQSAYSASTQAAVDAVALTSSTRILHEKSYRFVELSNR